MKLTSAPSTPPTTAPVSAPLLHSFLTRTAPSLFFETTAVSVKPKPPPRSTVRTLASAASAVLSPSKVITSKSLIAVPPTRCACRIARRLVRRGPGAEHIVSGRDALDRALHYWQRRSGEAE